MTDKCLKCGRTQSQIKSDAKSLGLLREFQTDVYTCCQIVAWGDEQSSAWFEATEEDNRPVTEFYSSEIEGALVLSTCAGDKCLGTDSPEFVR